VFVDNDGNVGIGTTSPLARLDVRGDGGTISSLNTSARAVISASMTAPAGSYLLGNGRDDKVPLVLSSENTAAKGIGGAIGFAGKYGTGGDITLTYAAIKGAKENSTDVDDNGYLAFGTRATRDYIIERMRITSAGNVGIGTTEPGYKLDVNGGVKGSYLIAAGDQSLFYRGSWIDPHSGIAYDAKFGGSGNGIAVQGTSIFNSSVGIGTANPGSYKLAVEGKIGAREVVVTLDNWSDFVLERAYPLMPLREVEQYIKQNKHLPDIPSEKEVLEKGVSLGEMQSKLLQKVEELTLYMIEQNKKIEKLEKENEELKNRVSSLEKKIQ
jgi:hypothetical protein